MGVAGGTKGLLSAAGVDRGGSLKLLVMLRHVGIHFPAIVAVRRKDTEGLRGHLGGASEVGVSTGGAWVLGVIEVNDEEGQHTTSR